MGWQSARRTAVVALVAAAVAVALWSIVAKRARTCSAECLNNLRQVATALECYSQDWDWTIAPSRSWASASDPYRRSNGLLSCPSARRGTSSYALNEALSCATWASLDVTPGRVPLVFDSGDAVAAVVERLRWRQGEVPVSAGGADLMRWRHREGASVCFLDGHAESVPHPGAALDWTPVGAPERLRPLKGVVEIPSTSGKEAGLVHRTIMDPAGSAAELAALAETLEPIESAGIRWAPLPILVAANVGGASGDVARSWAERNSLGVLVITVRPGPDADTAMSLRLICDDPASATSDGGLLLRTPRGRGLRVLVFRDLAGARAHEQGSFWPGEVAVLRAPGGQWREHRNAGFAAAGEFDRAGRCRRSSMLACGPGTNRPAEPLGRFLAEAPPDEYRSPASSDLFGSQLRLVRFRSYRAFFGATRVVVETVDAEGQPDTAESITDTPFQ
jgi:prepilin-type processing-associated H-X9-DG protein